MASFERAVIVRQLPQSCGGKEGKEFLCELADRIARSVRSKVVLDCSRVSLADKNVAHLLLCSLEEAMKRNGDVRLAGICPEVQSFLDAAGFGLLFSVFASVAEAVESYRRPAAAARPCSFMQEPLAPQSMLLDSVGRGGSNHEENHSPRG